jgi:hypothetical protein
VQSQREELAVRAREFARDDARAEGRAVIEFVSGERASLVLEQGQFRIEGAGTLPNGAKTPREALSALRSALARRSYTGLTRVLAAESLAALERDLAGLASGLEDPDALEVEVSGERATVRVPGGHLVRLKLEEGTWKVESFE